MRHRAPSKVSATNNLIVRSWRFPRLDRRYPLDGKSNPTMDPETGYAFHQVTSLTTMLSISFGEALVALRSNMRLRASIANQRVLPAKSAHRFQHPKSPPVISFARRQLEQQHL
jgi:hypothetical protein